MFKTSVEDQVLGKRVSEIQVCHLIEKFYFDQIWTFEPET